MDAALAEILDKAGLSAEQRTAAEAAFSIEGLGKVVKDGFMRQSDYSRKQDELRKKEATLEANWQKANAEYVAMQTELAEVQADRESTVAEKAEAARKLAEAEAKLADAAKNQIDPTKFVSVEDFDRKQREYAAGQSAYFGDILEIAAEHQQLFGTKISPKQLMKECIDAKKTPLEYWEDKYQVGAKRTEIAAAAETAKQTEWEKKGYEKRIAEEANPATREPRASENPFYVKDAAEGKQPWDESDTPASEQKFLHELQAARG